MSWVTQNPLNIIKGGDNKQGGFTKVKTEIDRIYTVLSGLFSTSGHGHTGADNDGPQIGTGGLADKAITTEKINDKAITTEKINDKAITTEKLAPTTVAGYGITDVYDKSTSDGKYAPSGYGLGTVAPFIADANNAPLGGCCASITNIPSATDNYLIYTTGINTNFIIQTAKGTAYNSAYVRTKDNGTWSAWKQLATTDSPVFTGSTILGGAMPANSWSLLGNSQVTPVIMGNTLLFQWKEDNGTIRSVTLTSSV